MKTILCFTSEYHFPLSGCSWITDAKSLTFSLQCNKILDDGVDLLILAVTHRAAVAQLVNNWLGTREILGLLSVANYPGWRCAVFVLSYTRQMPASYLQNIPCLTPSCVPSPSIYGREQQVAVSHKYMNIQFLALTYSAENIWTLSRIFLYKIWTFL